MKFNQKIETLYLRAKKTIKHKNKKDTFLLKLLFSSSLQAVTLKFDFLRKKSLAMLEQVKKFRDPTVNH